MVGRNDSSTRLVPDLRYELSPWERHEPRLLEGASHCETDCFNLATGPEAITVIVATPSFEEWT
jgi:hypothetical protein